MIMMMMMMMMILLLSQLFITYLRASVIRNHAVLPAIRHLNPSHAGRYSIYLTLRDGRLS